MSRDPMAAFDRLASRRLILFGGKGGVGKTTLAAAAALHYAETRPVVLFTTDPASNLADLFTAARQSALPSALRVEALDAASLYGRFLAENLESFLEIGDRGTYLDRDELRRFFELSLPGIDELMAWTRIGELVEENADATVVVDTAPTGHTLRMLSSSEHFAQLARALDTMEEKHRGIVQQFTRRRVVDAIDRFIDQFDERARQRAALIADRERSAFVPIALAEPLVVEQTLRLAAELRESGIDVPFALLNRAVVEPDCDADRVRVSRQEEAVRALAPVEVIVVPRSCTPLDSVDALTRWGSGVAPVPPSSAAAVRPGIPEIARMTFLAGKGGVGKTTAAASIALQLAASTPGARVVAISVDPAHSLPRLFEGAALPPNLEIEAVDSRARWRSFRDALGEEIERAIAAITPGRMTIAYDSEAMQRLIEIAPPGADEIFAVSRLAELAGDRSVAAVVVDTAPTGHFLRLLDLPQTAGEWVREFMRLLLRYREIVPAGTLGEELVRASRALKDLENALQSPEACVVVVTHPERVVVAETKRLIANVEARGIRVGGVIANYVTPESGCACDRSMRRWEMGALAEVGRAVEMVTRRDEAMSVDAIRKLVEFR